MLQLLFYVILISVIFNPSTCTVDGELSNKINCLTDERKIWYIDVNKRFIRTFYDFSSHQLEPNKKSYNEVRICDLEIRFEVDNIAYSEWFQLNRLNKRDGQEYLLVEHVQCKSLSIATSSRFNLNLKLPLSPNIESKHR